METAATLDGSRNGRISGFDRSPSSRPVLGITPDYELAKNAWTSASIWRTGSSFLDSRVDDEPVRPSPARQVSSTAFGHPRSAASAAMSPIQPSDENGIHSKMAWNSMSANVGFVSRPRGQPLSPTKNAQNHTPDPLKGPVGVMERSSLFADSAPDIEIDTTPHSSQSRNGRSFNPSPRDLQSKTRATGYDHHRPEYQPHTELKSNALDNGFFEPLPQLENGQYNPVNKHNLPNGVNAITSFLPMRTVPPQHPSTSSTTYREVSPTSPSSNGRLLPAEREDRYSASLAQQLANTTRTFQALRFDQANDIAGLELVRDTPLQPPQHRDFHGPQFRRNGQGTYFSPTETNFQPPSSHLAKGTSRLDPLAAPHIAGMPYGGRGTLSPMASDYRSNITSPYYSAAGTPLTGLDSIRSTPASGASSRTSHNDQVLLDHKLRNLAAYQYDQSALGLNSSHPQLHYPTQFDVQGPGLGVHLNPHVHPYPTGSYATIGNYAAVAPRMPSREPEQHQVSRSPVLEDFRMNSKTNKRFELKDIYNHVVEFSGDQHGSRFIQQKLETANSDEKEQIFKEIQPNLLQLMTDVFGNYVIQKMFEHGNQAQKKVLANQMRGHVWTLSMQMYGCRVVQKAFEYVLTDQQASLVKELDGPNSQILKIVKDQNGNHVVQKAIERIPGEHIQFIVDAHRGQVLKMSVHQYGCRVVQRMLEHCQPQAKRVILDELLGNIHPLILDSYGNYVVQHIIQNGEPADRRFVVNIVLRELLNFSKHKFASNIVEKSIDYADEDQQTEILRRLTTRHESGATPVLDLMRDQFGNYVLQKVHGRLQGAELAALEADMRHHYPTLKRISYGKQVGAIEKLLFGNNGPSTASTSSRDSVAPSTTASSTAQSPETPELPHEDK